MVTTLQTRRAGFRRLQERIDKTTSGGKLIFHVFGALAEFERDLIREHTHAGLTAAHARVRRGGRPRSMTEKQVAMALRKDPHTTIADVCKTLQVSRATLYRYLPQLNSSAKRSG
ncbi:recombinase family protein [Candidatus Acetothermia bacterium]|nr:recombinase family protein [Candidatus Acetothermia bacterium]